MNKRQAKKVALKHEMFISSFVSSYKELKEIDRSYHEYVISHKRFVKGCIGCEFFNGDCCTNNLFEPCIRER